MLGMLIHHSRLVTWVVRTIGKSLAILTVCPLVGGLLAGWAEDPMVGVGVGALVGTVWFLVFLNTTDAPMPGDDVVALLDDEV